MVDLLCVWCEYHHSVCEHANIVLTISEQGAIKRYTSVYLDGYPVVGERIVR